MNIIEVTDRKPTLIEQLLEVWESSVKATHLFLSENEIKEKLQKNSIQGVRFVRTGSVAYYHALSRAGYLVNDTSFPGRFIKKEGQIYLNTFLRKQVYQI